MALLVTVTKKSVSLLAEGQYQITLNMQYKNNAIVLLDQDFTEHYHSGQTPASVFVLFKAKMQETINKYKAEQVIFNIGALNTAVTTLQSQLEV